MKRLIVPRSQRMTKSTVSPALVVVVVLAVYVLVTTRMR